ncbi:MAG: dienelactone hydrolase family protein [Chloroflexota bacterium]|nr:dienelactone hydrolase family protein [Dehalococcoidia bacterium]MDW8254665.1 dienelactone hydrolase family protein [Chloroflexota bacterium]
MTEETLVLSTDEGPRAATLFRPAQPQGLILFAHGTGSSRQSPRNRFVAETLASGTFAALLIDLLTEEETRANAEISMELLASRLEAAIERASRLPDLSALPVGLYGASTGAAVALIAAARHPAVRAVVSRGGRTDLADEWLPRVRVPTLLIVGEHDVPVLLLNRQALPRFGGETRLAIVPGASHLFPEPGALERVATLTRDWFLRHLG